nr:hypothetical protein CFP56_54522 [Quercus suber]
MHLRSKAEPFQRTWTWDPIPHRPGKTFQDSSDSSYPRRCASSPSQSRYLFISPNRTSREEVIGTQDLEGRADKAERKPSDISSESHRLHPPPLPYSTTIQGATEGIEKSFALTAQSLLIIEHLA